MHRQPNREHGCEIHEALPGGQETQTPTRKRTFLCAGLTPPNLVDLITNQVTRDD